MSIVAMKRKSQRFQKPISKNGFTASGVKKNVKITENRIWVQSFKPDEHSQSSYVRSKKKCIEHVEATSKCEGSNISN